MVELLLEKSELIAIKNPRTQQSVNMPNSECTFDGVRKIRGSPAYDDDDMHTLFSTGM